MAFELLGRIVGARTWVRLPEGMVVRAEVHWYEAHGIGRKELKVKRTLKSTP